MSLLVKRGRDDETMLAGEDTFQILDHVQPSTLLPEQFFGSGEDPPAKRLMRAIFEDALVQVQKQSPEGLEARDWFKSSRDSWGSFLFVCDELGLDPNRARRFAFRVRRRRVTFRKIHRVTVTRTKIGGRSD